LSPSLSPSISPSYSPSLSPSISPSISPSASISPSVSPSLSPSLSPSYSPSISPSISPSPSPGWKEYTRGDYVELPLTANNLETNYSTQDVADVAFDDTARVPQTATGQYAIHQFKDYAVSNSMVVTCVGRSNINCSVRPVYLQIFNHISSEWETIDSDNETEANIEFTLEAEKTDLSNYKDGSNLITCRVYQQAQ